MNSNDEQVKIWICNDCGLELLNPYCDTCESTNTEEKQDERT